MSTSVTAPTTVEIGRGRLVALVVAVSALAAVVTWAVAAVAFDGNTTSAAAELAGGRGLHSHSPPRPCGSGSWQARAPPRPPRRTRGRSVDHVADTRRVSPAERSAPATPCRPAQTGPTSRRFCLDEPADAAIHAGDHEHDVRTARRRSRRAAVTQVTPGEERNPSPLLAGGRQREKMTNRTNQMTDRGPFPSPFEISVPPGCEGWEELYPHYQQFARSTAPSRRAASGFRTRCTPRSRLYPFDAVLLEFG